MPLSNWHIFELASLTVVILSIVESSRHKVYIDHGLTLVICNLCWWEAFAFTVTKITWTPHQERHKSQVSFRGLPCAHGVLDSPHEGVSDKNGDFGLGF